MVHPAPDDAQIFTTFRRLLKTPGPQGFCRRKQSYCFKPVCFPLAIIAKKNV